ncbi:alkaline phosphatase family protein [Tepidibacter aestuarii]|uniref:alkaline phosphatase family protein n=1 Tax=Tepidibacter aestuarii TaxID=2925782 RepID=UPI0020BD60C4|nr:alkaline phosphatase family protein [Tepidibacter aestuarii]CAH2214575.1 Sulfatase-like hydrolase/transferase [Tepidibacter aestuarii]
MQKVILVILDGLNYNTGISRMGFMHHLVEMKKAQLYKVIAALPSMSRPLYETILTGTNPIEHGITNNNINRRSKEESIFSIARKSGLKTGAAAYHWVSELYNKSPFNYIEDRIQNDSAQNIQNGMFYYDDNYPDSHLFLDAEYIRKAYDPDFLLIHPMGIDEIGHQYSSESKEYRKKAIEVDTILSNHIPTWIEEGYNIIVTADHGMNKDHGHGGIEDDERLVPMWTIGESFIDTDCKEVNQLIIAPTICKILGIEPSKKMMKEKFIGLK